MSTSNDSHIILDKELRREIDAIIQKLKEREQPIGSKGMNMSFEESSAAVNGWKPRKSRERSLAITKLQEAVMWLGMDLKAINDESGGAENPYPHSKDPSTTKIDPTADGLKL